MQFIDPIEEAKQRYEFARHTFQMLLTWFTFFCVLNITAFGWIVSAMLKDGSLQAIDGNSATVFGLIGTVAVMMLVSIALGVVALWVCDREFCRTFRRVSKIIDNECIPIPIYTYRVVISLMATALVTYFACWIALPVIFSWQTSGRELTPTHKSPPEFRSR